MPNAPSLHLMEAEARTQRAPQAPRACSRPARLMAGRRFLTSKVAKLLPSAATVNTHTHTDAARLPLSTCVSMHTCT